MQWTVTKLGFADVPGRFTGFTRVIRYDEARPEKSFVEVAIAVEEGL